MHSQQLPHVLCGASVLAVKGRLQGLLDLFLPAGYAMLMRPNKPETTAYGCHCPGDMNVRLPDRRLMFECVTSFYCLKGVVNYVKCVSIPIKNQDDPPLWVAEN